MDLEKEWAQFMQSDNEFDHKDNKEKIDITGPIPKATPLNISTKSKIIYLNKTFNLDDIFWKLKIIDYDDEKEGIIKKQIKFNFTSQENVNEFEKKIANEECVKIKIINQINNPTGRVKFKDVRKIDIGLSKKNVIKPNKQSKSAFYNCFVIVYRKFYEGEYKEFHMKLFNSGKVEIPGIKSEHMLDTVIKCLINILQPFCENTLMELKDKQEIVLVNSNFNCNYYLNREILVNILKEKYNIKCSMDSCSYPGIQCKYKIDKGQEVSFMIFRTGSILIVGKCSDTTLNEIYDFLVKMFESEYYNICEKQSDLELIEKQKPKKMKNKKKLTIYI
uniref:Tata-Box Binding Protein n=1 Tax=Florenciella sp. virus SA2 TaxID=3240092 RepID=A0AB39JBM9_9VIRU